MAEFINQETGSVVTVAKLNPSFKYEVAQYPGAEKLRLCFACGTCSASCPVREIEERFNPRRIIRMVLLGMKDRVLQSDFIWLCATCYTCSQRCPQGVRFADIMKALENIAVKEGHIHPLYRDQIKLLDKGGVLYEIDNRRRERSGLPPVRVETSHSSEIFELTGLSLIITPEEGKQE